jgi:outer membrane protein
MMNLLKSLLVALVCACHVAYAADAAIEQDSNLDSNLKLNQSDANIQQRVAQAEALFAAKNYVELKPLLASLRAEKPPHLAVLFISGMLASQQGDYANAAKEFRAMLARDPSLIRPRLELAFALQKSGDNRSAKYQYNQVLAANLPEVVRNNIYTQLGDVHARLPSYHLSVDIVSDSNPKLATSNSVVYIGGLPYRVEGSGSAKSATGVRLAGTVLLPLPSDPSWFLHGEVVGSEFGKRDFNSINTEATIGKQVDWGQNNLSAEIGGHIGNFHGVRYDGLLVRSTGFIRASDQWSLTAEILYKNYSFDTLSFNDGNLKGVGFGAIYVPKTTQRLEFLAGLSQYSAKESAYSFTQPKLGVAFTQELSGGWVGQAYLQYLVDDSPAPDPFFGIARHDDEAKVEFKLLNRKLQLWSFSPELLVGYVDRSSNIDFYSYKRQYAHIGFSTEF